MAGEFVETTLGNMLAFANGRASPERADDFPYPVYGSNGIIGYAKETNAGEGTIVIGRVGSYCGSIYLTKQRCWITNNAIRATALDGNDPRFLFYLLGTLGLNDWRAGSGQPLLNQDILSRIPTTVPKPPEQRVIGHILSTLDDKIELNRRVSESLETIARTLFRSWFVDFDPVRAKAAGRDPVLPKEIADLFPARLVNSELGEIPEGWGVKKLGDLLELAYGKALKAEDRRDGSVPVYGSNGQIGWHDRRLVPGPGIIVGRKGNPGIATWAPTDFFPIDTTQRADRAGPRSQRGLGNPRGLTRRAAA
jgi:restriction endonuclease S subunit